MTRLSGLVDRSTQSTTGTASTVAAGISTGGLGIGLGHTRLRSTTETRLVERMKPPPLKGGTRWKPIVIAFAFIIPSILLILSDGKKPLPVLFLAVLLALIGCYFVLAAKMEEWFPSRQQVETWHEGLAQLQSAFYCERDDRVFLPGTGQAMSPEDLVQQTFEPFLQSPGRRVSPW